MVDSTVRVFRPCKLIAVIMSIISLVLMIVAVAGPDWMKVTYFEGKISSWGLWWDCFQVNRSFKMCIETDWLGACAALVLIGLICMVMVSILGSIGLCTQKRPLYIFCAVTAIVSAVLQLICLIVYPVMFVDEVKENVSYNSKTNRIDVEWTYGIAWGATFFMVGAAILFLLRKDSQETEMKEPSAPPYVYDNYGHV